MKKKILLLCGIILCSLILLKLLASYIGNEIVISKYKKGKYDDKTISFLKKINLNQPYIVYYNEGNTFYKRDRFDDAIKDYEKALTKHPPRKQRCDIRYNMVLALLKKAEGSNTAATIQKLKEARDLLYLDNCASPSGDKGNSEESQELEQEISETIEQMENGSSGGSDENNNQQNGQGNDKDKKDGKGNNKDGKESDKSGDENDKDGEGNNKDGEGNDKDGEGNNKDGEGNNKNGEGNGKKSEKEQQEEEEYNNIENQIQGFNRDANSSRQQDLQTYENMGNYQYYTGKNW